MAETSTIFGFMKYVSATDILSDFKKTVDSYFVNSLKLNGNLIVVHAQVRVSPFYENQGYIQFGQIDDDEGVPHMWMKKKLQY